MVLGPWSLPSALAVLPEPDNLVYGQIVLSNNLVTAQQTNVVVEVRHSGDTNVFSTNVLASYPMGKDPNLGNHYSVEIPFWSLEETIDPRPSPSGSNLVIVVKETRIVSRRSYTYVRYRTNYVVGNRGQVARIDFGDQAPLLTGFDAWAQAHGLTAGDQDADGDGVSNLNEYIAGTDPKDTNSLFGLTIYRTASNSVVAFLGVQAWGRGAGYEDRYRYYFLETSANLGSGPWTGISNYTDLVGDDDWIRYPIPTTNKIPAFFRGRVELRGP